MHLPIPAATTRDSICSGSLPDAAPPVRGGGRWWLLPLILAVGAAAVSAQTPSADRSAETQLVVLEELEVIAAANAAGYLAPASRTATKTDMALIDLPQSLTVVTAEQIRDQQMHSLGDVVGYVPGVAAHQGENNRDQIIFRGQSSSADFFVNGVRDDMQYFRDVYNLDRLEILRGPNALAFGRGGGGGIINRATKEAGFAEIRELSLSGASFGRARATLDLNEPLGRQAAVRLNALWEHAGSFRDHVSVRRVGANPTATWVPSAATKVTLGYEYLRDRRTADRGITSWQGRPAPVRVGLFYGDPEESPVRSAVHLFTGSIEHRTAGGLEIRNRTLAGHYDRSYQNFVSGAVNASQALVALTAYNNASQRENFFNQTDFLLRAGAGHWRHQLLAGVEFGHQRTENFRNTGYFNNTATTLQVPYANPTISAPVTWRQSATDADNHLQAAGGAIYAQDQLEIGRHWQVVGGLRFDAFSLKYHNHRTGETLVRRDKLVSPRLGLVYKAQANLSLYGSYSVSHLPSSGDQFSSLTTITQQVKPERFSNLELGAKYQLRPELFLTVAAYRLDRTNTRATDPNDPTRILQTGSQRSQGVEAGLTGNLTRDWSVAAGYAYQDAFIHHTTAAAPAGARVAQVPRHSVSLWSKYQVTPRLGVGLGVLRRAAVFAAIDNSVTLPGFTRVDAALFYTPGGRWRAQVNIENLGNVRYFPNADSNTNLSPGAPLTVRASLMTRF